MSDKSAASYKKVLVKLNFLLHSATGKFLSTPIFCTDGESGLCRGLDDFISFNSSTTRRLICGFHQNQNLKSYYNDELQCEITKRHPNFNAKVYEMYQVSLKFYFLPTHTVKEILHICILCLVPT